MYEVLPVCVDRCPTTDTLYYAPLRRVPGRANEMAEVPTSQAAEGVDRADRERGKPLKLKPPSPSELGDRLPRSRWNESSSLSWKFFQKGYKDTSRDRALATMNNVLYHLHPVKVEDDHGLKLTYTFSLGGLSFFLFILLTIAGSS